MVWCFAKINSRLFCHVKILPSPPGFCDVPILYRSLYTRGWIIDERLSGAGSETQASLLRHGSAVLYVLWTRQCADEHHRSERTRWTAKGASQVIGFADRQIKLSFTFASTGVARDSVKHVPLIDKREKGFCFNFCCYCCLFARPNFSVFFFLSCQQLQYVVGPVCFLYFNCCTKAIGFFLR